MNRTIEMPLPLVDEVAPPAAVGTSVRCLVVDDHPAIRVGLRELMACDPGFVVVDAVASAEVAITVAEHLPVDVAIVEIDFGVERQPDRIGAVAGFGDHLQVRFGVEHEPQALADQRMVIGQQDVCLERRHGPVLALRLDPQEQAIFGMMSARVALGEIGRTLGLAHGELEALLCGMLRKLERIDRVRGG
jgi:CheY-like chemotaxis protein